MRRLCTALLAVTAGLVIVPAAATASALAAARPAVPTGYSIVDSAAIALPPGRTSVTGQVSCPPGTVPWGGGIGFTGGFASAGEGISTSAPTATGWTGRYSNSGTHTGDHFVLNAICAARPLGYTVVSAQADNPPGAVSTATATCPDGLQVVGGGATATATTSDVRLLSAWPLDQGHYRAVMSNGSATDQKLTAIAICVFQPAGYVITTQTNTGSFAPEDLSGAAACPAGTVIAGGGVQVLNPRPAVTLGSSLGDSAPQWFADVSIRDQTLTTRTISAICIS